jgi:phospholipid/cholesterol/gamma-HCH transport system substrate-binding protein
MNLFGTPEFKVGALVVVVSGLIGVMCLKVAEGPSILGRTKQYHFEVDNAGGLVKKGAVKMAGIKVGVIDDIELENGRAKIVLALDPDAHITTSSMAEMRSDGILGDKHVELIPGKADDPPLDPNVAIKTSGGGGGMDELMGEAKKVAVALNELLGTLNKAAKEGDPTSPIGRIILNVEQLSADLKDVTSANKGKVGEIIDRLRNISKNIDTYVNEETLASVDRSLKNIEEITDKVNKGEGTLGRLINDDQTVEELNMAISNVNKFLGTANQLETSMDFHSEYLSPLGAAKSYIGVRLQPGLDRYYEIYAIDDPRGVKKSKIQTDTVNGATTTDSSTTVSKNELKFTALFAKNFYDFTLKGGLMENAGGFGVDYHMMNNNLTLSVEAFNFQSLYLRAFAKYQFFKGIYVLAGGDNLSNSDQTTANWFVGAGLFITNDDLKALAARISL